MTIFPKDKHIFLLDGPAGNLEVLTSNVAESKSVTCIVCHPHPQHGGTMHNKVVYTLASTVNDLNVKAVRFNYRGVQKSEGEFGEGVGELEDLLAVYQWLKSVCPEDDIWLAGFSFGTFVSIRAMADIPEVAQLISVAPPAGHPYFAGFSQITCPWIVVQGEEDEIVDPSRVYEWVDSLQPKPELIRIPETGHFFHKKLLLLKQLLLEKLV